MATTGNAYVPSLRHTACLIAVHSLLGHVEDTDASRMIALVKTEFFSSVSLYILRQIIQDHPSELTDELLVSLAPPHVRDLSLERCSRVSKIGFCRLLNKCRSMTSLTLGLSVRLICPNVCQIMVHTWQYLASLRIDGCSWLHDDIVQLLLVSLRNLRQISVSGCVELTDEAFVLDEAVQKTPRQIKPCEDVQYQCRLTHVDISGCTRMTSEAVRHLTTVSGPTIESINLCGTRMDCRSLIYLAGYQLGRRIIRQAWPGTDCLKETRSNDTIIESSAQENTSGYNASTADDVLKYFGEMMHLDNEKVDRSCEQELDTESTKSFMTEALTFDHIAAVTDFDIHRLHTTRDIFLPTYNAILVRAYASKLNVIDLTTVEFSDPSVGSTCLKLLSFSTNLLKLTLSWKLITDEMLISIADNARELRQLSLLYHCRLITPHSLSHVGLVCPQLSQLNLHGVMHIDETALHAIMSRGLLTLLNVAESGILDDTVVKIAECCYAELQDLDLSSCDDMTSEGLDTIVTHCTSLRSLAIRNCQAMPVTIKLLAQNCVNIRRLDLSGLEIVDDALIIVLANSLTLLETLDISWNGDISDVGIGAVMSKAFFLKELIASGLQVTEAPFLPIIANLSKWRRCQTLLRVKLHERQLLEENGDPQLSSDEEFDDICLPHRSTVYTPNLRSLRLEYCARVNDQQMSEIVAVCRGTLTVLDYFANDVQPHWISVEKSSVYVP